MGVVSMISISPTFGKMVASTRARRMRSNEKVRHWNARASSEKNLSGLGGRDKPELRAIELQDRQSTPVVVSGASGRMGSAIVRALQRTRGLQLVGALDVRRVGEDAGTCCGWKEEIGVPIVDDPLVVLGSASQLEKPCVFVDFSAPGPSYENARQAMAFGLRPVIGTRGLTNKQISMLSEMADKSSLGCVISPNFSVGLALLQQAAQSAAFHYKYAEIVESLRDTEAIRPSMDALNTAGCISGLGCIFNPGIESEGSYWDMPTAPTDEGPGQGALVGDGVRVHSLRSQGNLQDMELLFSNQSETYRIATEMHSHEAYVPGVLLAIRKVVGLKSFVYGMESII